MCSLDGFPHVSGQDVKAMCEGFATLIQAVSASSTPKVEIHLHVSSNASQPQSRGRKVPIHDITQEEGKDLTPGSFWHTIEAAKTNELFAMLGID